MATWVAGYMLEDNDVMTLMKMLGLWEPEPDEEIDDDWAHNRFSEWAVAQASKDGFVPWPQWAELRDENRTRIRVITGLQTRVVARDPVTKKACYEESDFDRSCRDKFLAMTNGCLINRGCNFFAVRLGKSAFRSTKMDPTATTANHLPVQVPLISIRRDNFAVNLLARIVVIWSLERGMEGEASPMDEYLI